MELRVLEIRKVHLQILYVRRDASASRSPAETGFDLRGPYLVCDAPFIALFLLSEPHFGPQVVGLIRLGGGAIALLVCCGYPGQPRERSVEVPCRQIGMRARMPST